MGHEKSFSTGHQVPFMYSHIHKYYSQNWVLKLHSQQHQTLSFLLLLLLCLFFIILTDIWWNDEGDLYRFVHFINCKTEKHFTVCLLINKFTQNKTNTIWVFYKFIHSSSALSWPWWNCTTWRKPTWELHTDTYSSWGSNLEACLQNTAPLSLFPNNKSACRREKVLVLK